MRSSKTPGQAYDDAIAARYKLGAAHWVLAIVACTSFWNQVPSGGLNQTFSSGAGMGMAMNLGFGWIPYLISWFYSKAKLDGNRRGVLLFIVSASVIVLIEFGLNQRLLSNVNRPSPYFVCAGVTIALICVAKLCSLARAVRLD
jgi:hypothetical protein